MDFTITNSGYDLRQVDAYIAKLSGSYTELFQEYQRLKDQLDAVTAEKDRLETLNRSQANEITTLNAEKRAFDLSNYEQMISVVRQQTDQILDQAKRDAEALMAETQKARQDTAQTIQTTLSILQHTANKLGGAPIKNENPGRT